MEVFRPQNVYTDLGSVCIDLKIWSGCLAGIWSVRWGKLPQDVPSRRTNYGYYLCNCKSASESRLLASLSVIGRCAHFNANLLHFCDLPNFLTNMYFSVFSG